jgi:hypothetical protein
VVVVEVEEVGLGRGQGGDAGANADWTGWRLPHPLLEMNGPDGQEPPEDGEHDGRLTVSFSFSNFSLATFLCSL